MFYDLCLEKNDNSDIELSSLKSVFVSKSNNNYNYRMVNTKISTNEFKKILQNLTGTQLVNNILNNYKFALIFNDKIEFKSDFKREYYSKVKEFIKNNILFTEQGELSIQKLKKLYSTFKKEQVYNTLNINYKEFFEAFEELLQIRAYNSKFYNVSCKR